MPLNLQSFEKLDIPTDEKQAPERTKNEGVFPQVSNIMAYTHLNWNGQSNADPAKGADLLRNTP